MYKVSYIVIIFILTNNILHVIYLFINIVDVLEISLRKIVIILPNLLLNRKRVKYALGVAKAALFLL